jgi:hypothetical protein
MVLNFETSVILVICTDPSSFLLIRPNAVTAWMQINLDTPAALHAQNGDVITNWQQRYYQQ